MKKEKPQEAEAATSHLSKNKYDHGEPASPKYAQSRGHTTKNGSEIAREILKNLESKVAFNTSLENIAQSSLIIWREQKQANLIRSTAHSFSDLLSKEIRKNYREIREMIRGKKEITPFLQELLSKRIHYIGMLYHLHGDIKTALRVDSGLRVA